MNIDINTQELKSMAPIIDYVKTFYKDKIHIERENSDVVFAKCIFHEEKTASLAIFANGTYKCFGCGEHGDLITLVQKIEQTDFQNACMIIANNVGYKVNYINTNPAWEAYKDKMDNLNRQYWVNLQNSPQALDYLINKRRVTSETINEFRLGFTGNDTWKNSGTANIANRIVFPILEHHRIKPKCVGMAYKALNDEKPKYINDRNQDGREGQDPALNGVFIKGNMLYGLAQAYQAIAKFNFAFVVEGYFDVISMHQSGFKNTVGIMGTSFTEEQISTLAKLTKNVFLLLDSDSAGIQASKKHIVELLKHDIQVTICLFNEYKDPDEICKAFDFDNNKIYDFISSHMKDAVHYLIMSEIEPFKDMVSRERVKMFNHLFQIIDCIPNRASKMAYLKEIEKEVC